MFDMYVINLKERKDRLNHILNEFNNYNLNIIESIKDNEGWKGCFKSHKKCIEIAILKKLDFIIVLEDDCIKTEYFDKNIINIIEYLKQNMNRWNIFLGGVTCVENSLNYEFMNKEKNLIYIKKGKTSHFTIYNSNCYDTIIKMKINIPIDKKWYSKKLKIVSFIPFIATQKEDYSNIENRIVNYNSRFNQSEKILLNNINFI
jgi:GR25 family glycosyltransferase involved in LPS biosynthesis